MAAAGTAGLMVIASAAIWPLVPADAQVPIHWRGGEVTRHAGKVEALFSMPVLLLVVVGLLRLFDAVSPKPSSAGSAKVGTAALAAVVTVLHVVNLAHAVERDVDVALAATAIAGGLCLLAGLWLALRPPPPNSVIGLRFPWTVRNEEVWYPSNRLAGWLLTAFGLMLVGTTIVTGEAVGSAIVLGGLALTAAIAAAYSYSLAHRSD